MECGSAMNTLVICGLINAAIASLLATGAIIATWRWRNPYAIRAIWLVVLLKFIIPPIFTIQLPWLAESVDQQVNSTESISSSHQKFTNLQLPAAESNVLPPGKTETNKRQTSQTGLITASPQEESSLAGLNHSSLMLSTVGCIWLLGALLIAALVLHRIWKFHNLIRETRIAPNFFQQRVNQVADRIGVSGKLQVRLTDGGTPPLVWCLGKQPIIVLPSSLVGRLEESQATSMLAHEVMHVHRKDGWFRWLEILAVSLYWWCPFSWTARRMLQDAEERCCDADVLKCFPELRNSYANALLETLEFLAGADRLNFAGTGFARSSSLKRRFEMIVCPNAHVRPATVTRILMSIAAVVLIATTPVVSSSATRPAQSTQAVAPTAHSRSEVKDGTLLEGQVITLGDDRIIVARDTRKGAVEAQSEKREPCEKSTVWNLSLDDCFKMAFANNGKIQVKSDANGLLLLAPHSTDEVNDLDFRAAAEFTIRNVEDAYWNTWQALRNVEALRAGRDRALETWRYVNALQRVGETGGDAEKEAQARSQYYLFRSQVETALANFYRVENRLRYLMGLASSDARRIRPTDEPTTAQIHFDWATVNKEALSNRVEVLKQKLQVNKRQLQLDAAQNKLAERQQKQTKTQEVDFGGQAEGHAWEQSLDFSMTIGEKRLHARIRHDKLLLARELAIQKDLELQVSHQLGDALRDVELTYDLSQTNQNRLVAAREERTSVGTVFRTGRASLDLLLDSQRRTVEAERAYNKARVDYIRSLSRVHARKGTLLTRLGISIKQPK